MNIADVINPFFYRHDSMAIKDVASQLVSTAGLTTIYSLVDQIVIGNDLRLSDLAMIVPDENDVIIYGLDVILATDMGHSGRGPIASRNIKIFCRTLTVRGDPEKGITLDVSAYADPALETPIQPDNSVWLNNISEKAANGTDIAYAVNNPDKGAAYTTWFSEGFSALFYPDKRPVRGWGLQGNAGGNINIACQKLVLECKLNLYANGGRGNAGIGGQNVKNWMPGLVGGDAGSGGPGGESGFIQLTYNECVDADNNTLDDSWININCDPGIAGIPGQPGSADEPGQENNHHGNYAKSATETQGKGFEKNIPDLIITGEVKTVDASMVAVNADLHYWALLYHRIKFDYLINQPMQYKLPSAIDPDWVKLSTLCTWGSVFAAAYGKTSPEFQSQFIGDVINDSNAAQKNTIATALTLMDVWQKKGMTMWGYSVATVPLMPLETLMDLSDKFYQKQIDVRNFYIKIRNQEEKGQLDDDEKGNMSTHANYVVQMYLAKINVLKKNLFGDTTESSVDVNSLLGELNDADSACNTAIDVLMTKLAGLDAAVKAKVNLNTKDVLDAVKNVIFVAGETGPAMLMAGIEGYGLYDKAVNEITDDAGNSTAKSAVISKVDNLTSNTADLKSAMKGIVDNNNAGKLNQAILTNLDNITNYIDQFKSALGGVAQDVLDEVDELRGLVNDKNDLWVDYNNKLSELAKANQDYQNALAKQQKIDTTTRQELSANLIDLVQLYTTIYLDNLERAADLRAQLLRKYAYIALDAKDIDADFFSSVTSFWAADSASVQGIADRSDSNWSTTSNIVMGTDNSDSIRQKLAQYDNDSGSPMLKTPLPVNDGQKSIFSITIRGDGNAMDKKVIQSLLSNKAVWLVISPANGVVVSYTDENGNSSAATTKFGLSPQYPLATNGEWDMRITHINPWIEGVSTDTGTVVCSIKVGLLSFITAGAVGKQTAYYFDYNKRPVNTEFSHSTNINLNDQTNQGMKLDGALTGEGVAETSGYIDKRGIYTKIRLWLVAGGNNTGLRAMTDISKVNLKIYFRVLFRAPN